MELLLVLIDAGKLGWRLGETESLHTSRKQRYMGTESMESSRARPCMSTGTRRGLCPDDKEEVIFATMARDRRHTFSCLASR
jgi:hypothetical protein